MVWAGLEVPISVLEDRMDQTGVDFDVVAIGYGMRGAVLEPIVERFEGESGSLNIATLSSRKESLVTISDCPDLIDMYQRKAPVARKVFNYNPESFIWSVSHRMPTIEDCAEAGKPGKLLVINPSLLVLARSYNILLHVCFHSLMKLGI